MMQHRAKAAINTPQRNDFSLIEGHLPDTQPPVPGGYPVPEPLHRPETIKRASF